MRLHRKRMDYMPRAATPALALERAWGTLLDLARTRRRGMPAELCERDAAPEVKDFFDLYLPVCGASAAQPITVGHLGQSIDGHIATAAGHSFYVTGEANLVHLHRMRALCDAVLVGARTVANDDPSLTTRHVRGENPVRVIVDPEARLADHYKVFVDGQARTLIAYDPRLARGRVRTGQEEPIAVSSRGGRIDLQALLAALHERGLYGIFVEGGGVTVSHFLEARLLDRLHVATAPVLMGSGRRGLQLPPVHSMQQCARPAHRVFRMGEDILWDFDLRAEQTDASPVSASHGPLRIR